VYYGEYLTKSNFLTGTVVTLKNFFNRDLEPKRLRNTDLNDITPELIFLIPVPKDNSLFLLVVHRYLLSLYLDFYESYLHLLTTRPTKRNWNATWESQRKENFEWLHHFNDDKTEKLFWHLSFDWISKLYTFQIKSTGFPCYS